MMVNLGMYPSLLSGDNVRCARQGGHKENDP